MDAVLAHIDHFLCMDARENPVSYTHLDLLGHEKVVILDHADLRGHLQRDRAGQLQIVRCV